MNLHLNFKLESELILIKIYNNLRGNTPNYFSKFRVDWMYGFHGTQITVDRFFPFAPHSTETEKNEAFGLS